MKTRPALPFVLAAALVRLLGACDSSDSSGAGGGFDAGDASFVPPDGGVPDGFVPPVDAGGVTYNDMTQAQFWTSFDTAAKVDPKAKGFEGSVFDGRYVYLFPYTGGGGTVTRYDTKADFATATSWLTYDTTNVDANAKGFAGGTFDGRYVYLAPRQGLGNVITRYDTQADFATKASWSTFTTTPLGANVSGFVGAVHDGRYVYFVPYNDASNAYHGNVARYDTQLDFTQAGSWTTFDTATNVDANAKGFYGGVFDGRYLYLIPWITANGPVYGSLVTRYDTTASFTDPLSWAKFDTATKPGSPKGFSGGAFDGRYLYLVPAAGGTAVRYDTKADFATAGSWGTFDVTSANTNAYGFTGATFDGRYVYFAPYSNTTYDGVVARYDTTADFAQAGSWKTFDTAPSGGAGFIGNVFDGRYVYFVACTTGSFDGIVLRFDSKSPPSMPDLYGTSPVKFHGSFL